MTEAEREVLISLMEEDIMSLVAEYKGKGLTVEDAICALEMRTFALRECGAWR